MPSLIIGPSMSWLDDALINNIRQDAPELQIIKAQYKEFPDGESYVRLPVEALDPDETVILQTLSPPQDKSFIQLLQIVDAALNLGADKIAVFTPYMAYARQDKIFLKGEPVSVRLLLTSIYATGARFLFTIDIHNPDSLSLFPGKSYNLMPMHLAVKPLVSERSNKDIMIIAPDKGALQRAKMMAEAFGFEYDYLDKQRDRITGEIIIDDREISVKNRTVVIIDDIISTGGTIALATKKLYAKGARDVYVACSHALLVGDSYVKIKSSGVKEIFSLNTLPPKPGVTYIDAITWSVKRILESI
jgi:ribose-phosphate pyrophosphokinase